MDKIRVLHILYDIQPSGAEMMLFSAYPFWKDECEMCILATGPTGGEYAQTLKERGYHIDYLPIQKECAPGAEKKVNKILHLRAFEKYMRANCFDVVHIHKESLSENYAKICAHLGVKKIVRTVHSTFQFEGALRERKARSRTKMQQKYGVCFVAISDGVAQNEKKVFNLECDQIIYNWCDDQKYQAISEAEKNTEKKAANVEDKLTILTSATCNHVKNHELLIRALDRMKERDKLYYYHVGYREHETEREMELAHELKLDDIIEFAGYTNPQIYMKKTDLFVMTSLYEGLSISALEAIFSGVHLLLADTRGLNEFKKQGLSTVHYFQMSEKDPVGEENIQVLAAALDEAVRMWEKGDLCNEVSQRERASELYSANVGAKRYLKLYTE